MKIDSIHEFNCTKEELWERLHNKEFLNDLVGRNGDIQPLKKDSFNARTTLQISRFHGEISGKVEITDAIEHEKVSFNYDLSGDPGFIRGDGQLKLIPGNAETTRLLIESDVDIGGGLASLGRTRMEEFLHVRLNNYFSGLENGRTPEKGNPLEDPQRFGSQPAAGQSRFQQLSPEIKLLFYIVPVVSLIVLFAVLLKSCGG